MIKRDKQEPTALAPVLEFDYTRCVIPGKGSWPERHYGQKFGPSLVRKALAAGLYVMAEIPEAPRAVPVSDAGWDGDAFVVVTLEGRRIPSRIFTLTTLKGFKL